MATSFMFFRLTTYPKLLTHSQKKIFLTHRQKKTFDKVKALKFPFSSLQVKKHFLKESSQHVYVIRIGSN